MIENILMIHYNCWLYEKMDDQQSYTLKTGEWNTLIYIKQN